MRNLKFMVKGIYVHADNLGPWGVGGYADLRRVTQWNLDFMAKADEGQAYLELSRQIDAAIKFMVACGLEYSHPIMTETDFHVGHECLLLDYEQV